MIAEAVGRELQGSSWVGIPFAGGMAELLHITARTVVVSDKHWQIINLAETAADPVLGPQLYRRLRRKLFHGVSLSQAQQECRYCWTERPEIVPSLDAAEDYFVAVWMNRSALAGTDGEFKGNLPVRWNANGGDSAIRYQSAVKSLLTFRRFLERCNFVCMDCFEFIAKVKDEVGNALYCDPPWIDDGNNYKHKFTDKNHADLSLELLRFKVAKIVMRFGDHPRVRELYPETHWRRVEISGRTQANNEKKELLLVRR